MRSWHTPKSISVVRLSGSYGLVLPQNPWGRRVIWQPRSGYLAPWENILKRSLDLLFSTVGILLAAPLMAYVALRIRLTSRGPVLFSQERIGKDGRPFTIFKFRSMVTDAEINGPALSSDEDGRVTRFGRVIRRWRLDELPQLWNVLKGEMSVVGPRPERQYFIDRITDHAPNYNRLLRLKPGLTSMGIVNFGYASSVEEMVDRQRHDQYYFENRSLWLDLGIMLATLDVILRRKGK